MRTSPVQARTMENAMDKDQLKLFVLVKFTRDSDDATHSHQFTN